MSRKMTKTRIQALKGLQKKFFWRNDFFGMKIDYQTDGFNKTWEKLNSHFISNM